MTAARLAAVALALAACGAEPDSSPGRADADGAGDGGGGAEPAIRILDVALVESIPWRNELAEGVRHRIVIRTTVGLDTIAGLATTRPPIVAGDSLVYGFAVGEQGEVPSGFVYDPRSGELRWIGLPEDFLEFTAFALAPDAAHLAYAGRAADGAGLAAIVRRWPEGTLVYRSGPVSGYPSDATNSEVRWLEADSVEILIRLDDLEAPGGSWLRARGAPSEAMAADTVILGS